MTSNDHVSMYDELVADPREAVQLAAAELAMEVVELLNHAMAKSGMTQRQVAELVGVNESRVSQLLSSDGNLRVSSLAKFARAMGYDVELDAIPVTGGPRVMSDAPRRRNLDGGAESSIVWHQTFALSSGCVTVPVTVPPVDGADGAEPMGPPVREGRASGRRIFHATVHHERHETENFEVAL